MNSTQTTPLNSVKFATGAKLTFDIGGCGSQAAKTPTLTMVEIALRSMPRAFSPAFVAFALGISLWVASVLIADCATGWLYEKTISGINWTYWPETVTLDAPVVPPSVRLRILALPCVFAALTIVVTWLVIVVRNQTVVSKARKGLFSFPYVEAAKTFQFRRRSRTITISDQGIQSNDSEVFKWNDLVEVRIRIAGFSSHPWVFTAKGVFTARFRNGTVMIDTDQIPRRYRRVFVDFMVSILRPLELSANAGNLSVEKVTQERLEEDRLRYPLTRVFTAGRLIGAFAFIVVPTGGLLFSVYEYDPNFDFQDPKTQLALAGIVAMLAIVVAASFLFLCNSRRFEEIGEELKLLSVLGLCPFCDKHLVAKDGNPSDFSYSSTTYGRRKVRVVSGSIPRCRKCSDTHANVSSIRTISGLLSITAAGVGLLVLLNEKDSVAGPWILTGSVTFFIVFRLLAWYIQRTAGVKPVSWAYSKFPV